MSTVLEKAVASAAKAIADPKWVERGVAQVNAKLDGLDPALSLPAAAGLDYLEAHRETVATVAAGTFLDLAHHLSLGDEEGAHLAWLDAQATPEERTAARLDVARQNVLDEDEAGARWDAIKSIALGFLKVAGQAALPILIEILKGAIAGGF